MLLKFTPIAKINYLVLYKVQHTKEWNIIVSFDQAVKVQSCIKRMFSI